MKPEKAAGRFVRRTLRSVFRDFLDLAEPAGNRDGELRAAFRAVEQAVRETCGVRQHDLAKFEDDVLRIVPRRHRKAVRKALNRLSDAENDFLAVREQTAYLVGVAVGQMIGSTAMNHD